MPMIQEKTIYQDIIKYLNKVQEECKYLLNFCNLKYQVELFDKTNLLHFIYSNGIHEIVTDKGTYYFHGIGCTLEYKIGNIIQWDFGYGNRWCGIDVFFFREYSRVFLNKVYSLEEITEFCDECVSCKIFFKNTSQYYIFYYMISEAKISIPDHYDSIIITFRDQKHMIKRNKLIERFVRKATCCYSEISNLDDNFEVTFCKDGYSVYKILYNEQAYSPSAVKIMTNQIINPIFKSGVKDYH